MIKFNNLCYSYENENIINNINFEINDNDYMLIHGENGSGKTTLLKCLLGLNKVKDNMVYIDEIDVNQFSDFTKIGYVEQYKRDKIDISITASELLYSICNDKNKVKEVCELLNINDLLNMDISNMSGGQFQKINIAKSLLFDVKYLILDEPNTGLDHKSRKQLYDILTKLHKKGMTIILISHQLDEVSCQINKLYEISTNTVIIDPKENCEYC